MLMIDFYPVTNITFLIATPISSILSNLTFANQIPTTSVSIINFFFQNSYFFLKYPSFFPFFSLFLTNTTCKIHHFDQY